MQARTRDLIPHETGCHRSGAALAEFDKVATDDHAQFRHYREHGYFAQAPEPYADPGEIVAGRPPGRERAEERTMAFNLGIALDDMALAPEILRRANQRGLGTWLPLWGLDEPPLSASTRLPAYRMSAR